MRVPTTIEFFCNDVRRVGGRALLVGGCVRDALLGIEPSDYDIEVYGLPWGTVEAIAAAYGVVKSVGQAFGVMKLTVSENDAKLNGYQETAGLSIDISLPRRDSKTGDGHRDFAVETDPNMPEEEAFRRRDFTMNAIGYDPTSYVYHDDFHGREDIRYRVLRVVDPVTFVEDPLRALRALQFASRFRLKLGAESIPVLASMGPLLRHLPRERVYAEWRKLLLSSKPSIGLRYGMDLGLFADLPELTALVGVPQQKDHHPEGCVFEHTCLAADVAANVVRRESLGDDEAFVVVLAALCHDFGKPSTTATWPDGKIKSKGHEEAGEAPTRTFLERIGVGSPDVTEKVVRLVCEHLKPTILYGGYGAGRASYGAIRRLAARLPPASIRQLVMVAEADKLGRGNETDVFHAGKWLLDKAAALSALNQRAPNLIEGKDILFATGCAQGPHVGKLIRLANELRDDHEVTREDVLAAITGKNVHEAMAALLRIKRWYDPPGTPFADIPCFGEPRP